MKTDARVRYTKMVLQNSMLVLLQDRSIRRITVTDLCQMAEINRATFYKHYYDVYDLLEKIEADVLNYIRESAMVIRDGNASNTLTTLLEQMLEKHSDYAVLFSENGNPYFSEKISECLYEEIAPYVKQRMPEIPDTEKELIYGFLERGGSGIIDRWLRQGMVQSPERVVQLILQLSRAVISGITSI